MSSKVSSKNFLKIFFGFLFALALALLLRFLIHSYLVFPFVLQNGDMEPNLKKGSRVYVWRIFNKDEELRRGSLVLLVYPPREGKSAVEGKEYHFIRRIIALGGEEISIVNHRVYINGKPLSEVEKGALWEKRIQEYHKKNPVSINKTAKWNSLTKFRIKKGEIFVLADKRTGALDSRLMGSFSLQEIKGIIKE